MCGASAYGSRQDHGQAESCTINDIHWRFRTQPKEYIRLRYSTELKKGKSCNLDGQDSTRENPTYPSVEIFGWSGRASILACLVTAAEPYRSHPNTLVGPECVAGVFTRSVRCQESGTLVVLSNLGIERTKVQEAVERLAARSEYWKDWADPFRQGYDHLKPSELKAIDMKAMRMCIQLYRQCDMRVITTTTEQVTLTERRRRVIQEPVVSNIIRNSHLHYDLKILRVFYGSLPFDCSAAAATLNNLEVLLLCEKVNDVVTVVITRTEELMEGSVLYSFEAKKVHGQVAIIFKMPIDKIPQHLNKVFVRLIREGRDSTSNPVRITIRKPEIVAGHATSVQCPAIQENPLHLAYSSPPPPGRSICETYCPNLSDLAALSYKINQLQVPQAAPLPSRHLPDLSPKSKDIIDDALQLREETNRVSISLEMLSMTADDVEDIDDDIDVESF